MNSLAHTVLSISASPELSLLAKATLFLLIGLAASRLAARQRASTRHLIWAGTFAALLALLLVVRLAPNATLGVPVPIVVADRALTEVPLSGSGSPLIGSSSIPSIATPMFSNSPDSSHMIQ